TSAVTILGEALGLSPAGWEALALEWKLPRYRGRQIFDALHGRGVRDYGAMRELPADLRERLGRELPIRRPEVTRREEASDGSVKYALRLADGALVEAVYMPGDEARSAANEFTDAREQRDARDERESPKSKARATQRSAASQSGIQSPKSKGAVGKRPAMRKSKIQNPKSKID
ncbi:MAG: hypothetical protein ACRD00_06580, partial [Thermoanaerobaculia bacterium]